MDNEELSAILEMMLDKMYPDPLIRQHNVYRDFDKVLKSKLYEWSINRTATIGGVKNQLRAAAMVGVNRNTFRKWK